MRVPVLVDAWQQECCGTPFAVGGVVRWQLAADRGWAARALDPQFRPRTLELLVEAVYGAAGDEPAGCLLVLGELQVFLDEDPPPALGELRTVGLLQRGPPRRAAAAAAGHDRHRGERPHGAPGTRRPGRARAGHVGAGSHVPRADRPLQDVGGRDFTGFLVELDVDTGG